MSEKFNLKKRNKFLQFPIDIIRNLFFVYYDLLMKFRAKHEYILVIAMKRSGSSLLAHILSSNPEINGHGEAWIMYSRPKDFKNLIKITHWTKRMLKMPTRYVMDKLVHDRLIQKPELLNTKGTKVIILIREPEGCLPSLIKEELKYLYKFDEEDAVAEYENRLKTLASYIDYINDKSNLKFLTYSEIVNNSEETLNDLKEFLGLKSDLKSEYKLNRTSGKPIFGDTSENIKQGKILNSEKPKHTDIQIPKELIERANVAYENCIKEFSKLKK